MPNTACEGDSATNLFHKISNYCPRVNLATVQRKYFNEGKGKQQLNVTYSSFLFRTSDGASVCCV